MKKIFTGNKDYNKTAFLNWRISDREDIRNLIILAEGYLSSAIKLIKCCLTDNTDKKADMLIFPILNNANHGIELYLKALIWTLNRLQKSEMKIEGSHNIKQMLDNVKSKISQYKDNDWLKSFKEQNIHLTEYINELFSLISIHEKSDNMDFSRYPTTNKYENHFYVDRLDNVEIDLEHLLSQMELIKEGLEERVSYFFYQELNGEW